MMSDEAKKERDRRLRRKLLYFLYLCRTAPKAGMGARAVIVDVEEGQPNGMGFEDDTHALQLLRDLVNKALIIEERTTRRRGQLFGPDFLFLRITDRGSMLCREEIAADPDIYDARITGDE